MGGRVGISLLTTLPLAGLIGQSSANTETVNVDCEWLSSAGRTPWQIVRLICKMMCLAY